MIRLLIVTIAALLSGFRSQSGLMVESLTLCQPLSAVPLKRRPRIRLVDRVSPGGERRLAERRAGGRSEILFGGWRVSTNGALYGSTASC
jgi:hypothetical protein